MIKNKILGFLFIIISIVVLIYNYQIILNKNMLNNQEIALYFAKTTTNVGSIPVSIKKLSKNTSEYDYIAVLEIPDINLKRGIVALDNDYNDIKYNIQLISGSDMPDIPNSNIILAAHNGNSDVSFFKDLEKLEKNNKVYLYYNGTKYIYQIDNSYIVKKTGIIDITRDNSKNTITLITCKNNSDNEQIIYIGYLMAKEKY